MTIWLGLAGSSRPSAHIVGGAEDSAQHTLEECPAWAVERGALVAVLGPDLDLGAVLGAAASAPEKWRVFLRFAEAVMTAKELAERVRQAELAAPPGHRRRRVRQ